MHRPPGGADEPRQRTGRVRGGRLSGVGRPRASAGGSTSSLGRLSPRAQILDAAAALFAQHGVAATSTRAIADRVGVRQASLYHHFATKHEMLVELLSGSVRPSLEFVQRLEDRVRGVASAPAALYALAVTDVRTLTASPHNVGVLYLSPEVQHGPFGPFRQERRQLQAAYGRLGAACAEHAVVTAGEQIRGGAILIQLAELVIQLRQRGEAAESDADVIAATCLRACGLDRSAVEPARQDAAVLLEALQRRPGLPD